MDNFITNEIFDEHTTKYDNLVLSGGGVKGIVHLGSLYALVSENIIDTKKLKNIAAGKRIANVLGKR